jgi:hypothetical protein
MAQSPLSRRQFFVITLAGLAALVLPPMRVFADAQNRDVSAAEERDVSLRLQTQLGASFTIRRVSRLNDLWLAAADFQDVTVHLKSSDGLTWYTAGWQPPAAA